MNIEILVSIVVAAGASIGGLISIYTREEIERYDKTIKYSELILSSILAIFMLTAHQHLWSLIFLFFGAAFVILINEPFFHIHLNRYIRMVMFGISLGIIFHISKIGGFGFSAILFLYNILKGSRVGAYYVKGIFKKIGEFQGLFLLSFLLAYYFSFGSFIEAAILNFCVGSVIATIIGTK